MSVFLISCSNDDVTGSVITLCTDKENAQVCDFIHNGAFCSIQKAETTRALVIQSRNKTVKNAYAALTTLDEYKACLDNVVLAQSAIKKSDEVSRFATIANIPRYQDKIVKETKGVRPEINLWLYKKTGNRDYWESMINGVDMAKSVHQDVFIVMMAEAASNNIEEAKKIADSLLRRTELLNQLSPEVFKFYITYFLNHGDEFKSAVWHGLYAEYVENKPGINTQYFQFHKKMKSSTLEDAQELVDSIVFDTNWLGSTIKDIEKLII
ncbi:DUF2989 domain-containing protein [Paraglaciecola aquimarina]|uniref:DUF2989 domain-containing protein n=1 Tax=Paraglaciecola algarum TaxID=3050085 RepID=A0ABS9D6K7_9ALTE|nr:DUF2989 domain-containing protein [Paraglaciecola sp. G1-23]MCF2948573.1 DUF2989 domain-containing protein [Paraglaciecola sp. G1-23]